MRLRASTYWTIAVVVSLGMAIGIGTWLRLHFLVSSINMSNPPQCFNHYGERLSCDLSDYEAAIYLATMAVLFAAFLTTAAFWRRSRKS